MKDEFDDIARACVNKRLSKLAKHDPTTVSVLADDVAALLRNTDTSARKQALTVGKCAHGKGDPPQDCNWPYCGCDPSATEAMHIAQEDITSGWRKSRYARQHEAFAHIASLRVAERGS